MCPLVYLQRLTPSPVPPLPVGDAVSTAEQMVQRALDECDNPMFSAVTCTPGETRSSFPFFPRMRGARLRFFSDPVFLLSLVNPTIKTANKWKIHTPSFMGVSA